MAYVTYGLSVVLVLQVLTQSSEGGICWSRKTEKGRCQGPFQMNVTMDKCCTGSADSVSWTPHKFYTTGDIFYWRDLDRGAPGCKRCHHNCDNVACPQNKKCRMKSGVPKCVCRPTCTRRMRRKKVFCGTDGRRYKNICQLLRRKCQLERNINVAYRGPCKRSCKKVKCLYGRTCVEDQNGMPHCVYCKTKCPTNTMRQPVCGEDGLTYQSICELRNIMCWKGYSIRIAYEGICREDASCSNTKCLPDFKCMVNPATRRPQCVHCSNRTCSSLSKYKVCGTDGVSYKNYCKLKENSCKMGIVINTKHSGRCEKKRKSCRKCKIKGKNKKGKKRNKSKIKAYFRNGNGNNVQVKFLLHTLKRGICTSLSC